MIIDKLNVFFHDFEEFFYEKRYIKRNETFHDEKKR